MNCGFDFKKQSSKVLSETEKAFTIFATVGAEAGEVASDTVPGNEEDFHQESSSMVADDAELYGPSADMADLNEPNFENSDDFELDLSETEDLDSEGWDIGATLTGDLSEIASVAPEESLNNADLGTGKFEVQGLGFDLTDGLEQEENKATDEEDNSSLELEYNVFADETAAPEMEPYAGQNEIEFELTEDESSHQTKFEDTLHEPSNREETGPAESLELGEISLETELEPESKKSDTVQTPEVPIDLTESEIELKDSTFELEKLQMDLETDPMVIEPIQTVPSGNPKAPLEDPKLKMDSGEDETNPFMPDKEPTPDR